MTILPETPRGSWGEVAPIFTRPTFRRFLTLLGAAILTVGRRTVANLLRTAGSLAAGAASSYRRVFSRARRSSPRLACALARKAVAMLPAGEPIILVGDIKYLALILRFPLRPLRTDAELDAASAIVGELVDRDDLSPTESDYLDVLGDLIEKYENEHVAMPHVSDGAMFRSLMDEKGVRQADVTRGTGISKTVLSLVLNGKRDLTREHIGALAKYFDVNPASFLGAT